MRALVVVLLVSACEQPHFTGTLGVTVDGPPTTRLGLFPRPSFASPIAGVATTFTSCDIVTTLAEGSLLPAQEFEIVEGEFSIELNPALPPDPNLALAAWVDLDDD